MKKTFLSLATLSLALSIADAAFAAVKVFILAGQSNMCGDGAYPGYFGKNSEPWTMAPYNKGADAPCPAYLANQPSIKFWNYNDGVALGSTNYHAIAAGNGWINLQEHFGSTGAEFGPELSFGYRMHELFPNDEIYIVKTALGATNLAKDWKAYSGEKYAMLRARTQAALSNLLSQGKRADVEGMLWMQGEDDSCTLSWAQSYGLNMKNLIEAVRSDFYAYDGLNMKFVTGRITTMGAKWVPLSTVEFVREAQVNVTVPGTPYYVPNTAWVDTDDLQWAFYGHYGTEGQIELGARFAEAFAPVPEPTALALATTGLLGLFVAARRNRRNRVRM
jgi:hypothetical protein